MQGSSPLVGIIASLAIVATACGGAAGGPTSGPSASTAARSSPAPQALIDGAKAEGGKLDLTWANYANKAMVEEWKTGFERLYGIKPTVAFTPEPAMNAEAAKLIQEVKAGRPASTDVFLSTEVHILTVQQQVPDLLLKVDWSWSQTISGTPKVVEGDGQAIHFVTALRGITYNPDRLKGADVPTSLADVLRLSSKYAVASTPQASIFDTISTPDIWGEQRTIQYATDLSKNLKGLIQGQELNRISNGEFDVLVIDQGKNEVESRRAQGQRLAWAFPSDAPVVTEVFLSIPKHTVHPNMAKLWVHYVMTREAQDFLMKYEFLDNVLLPGSKNVEDLKKLEAQGVKYFIASVDFARRNADAYARVRPQLQKILSRQ